jgi:hypothetical protein
VIRVLTIRENPPHQGDQIDFLLGQFSSPLETHEVLLPKLHTSDAIQNFRAISQLSPLPFDVVISEGCGALALESSFALGLLSTSEDCSVLALLIDTHMVKTAPGLFRVGIEPDFVVAATARPEDIKSLLTSVQEVDRSEFFPT